MQKEYQMYIESNRRAAQSRADADFLRRMLGGELNSSANRARNDSNNVQGCCEWRPQARQEAPTRPEGGCDCQRPSCNTSCPTEVSAPSLAMVYCPRQCWRKLFSPEEGLKHGTLFAELDLPFEGSSYNGRKEGCARRMM
jgi:hypothetical protein